MLAVLPSDRRRGAPSGLIQVITGATFVSTRMQCHSSQSHCTCVGFLRSVRPCAFGTAWRSAMQRSQRRATREQPASIYHGRAAGWCVDTRARLTCESATNC